LNEFKRENDKKKGIENEKPTESRVEKEETKVS